MAENAAIIETQFGLVAGRGQDVLAFKGIPYAAPPIGPLRWRPPAPAKAWDGVLEAHDFTDDCMQADNPHLRGAGRSEDCLYLNIWTPAERGSAPLPVMVWFPGGGFVAGSGSDRRADGEALARTGVIVVTFSYRVGIFGFLAHPGLSAESPVGASGNYGLMDQIAALEWVRDTIGAFGGDPKRVTAFGVSAGSASIALLMTSPKVKDLFHRVILQSPGAFRPLTELPDAEQVGLALGDDISALRQRSAAELFAQTGLVTPKRRALTGPRPLRPIRDGVLLVEDDRDAWRRGAFEAMPIIVGNNADEGSTFTTPWTIQGKAAYAEFLSDTFGNMAAEAADVYPAASDADVSARLADLFGDTQFNYGGWGIAQAAHNHGAPVWRYLLTRNPGGRAAPPLHGEDVVFAFGNLHTANVGGGTIGAQDEAVSQAMMTAWRRFAYGETPGYEGIEWPQYESSTGQLLELGDDIQTNDGWRQAQLAFIDRYYNACAAKARSDG